MNALEQLQLGWAAGHGFLMLALNPLLYIGAFLWVWERIRNAKPERMLFGVRWTRVRRPLFVQLAAGLAAGVVLSVGLCAAGVAVTPSEVWAVSGVSLGLAVLRLRWWFLPYSVSLLAAVHAVVGVLPQVGTGSVWASVLRFFRDFHSTDWLALAAGASLLNASLLWLYRGQGGAPTAVHGKRGGVMGGLVFQTAFLAAVWIPTAHDAAQLGGWRWWQANGDGLTLTAVPLFVGCSLLVTVQPVRRAVVRQAGVHLLLAVCLAGGAAWGLWQDAPASLVAAFAVWMVLEGAVILFLRQEQRQDGRYAETPAGVRVLAVVPKSGAAELGLQPGEVITHVNQVPVHSSYDLHFALDQNPAYAKLQVVDTRGEARFVGAPVYDGERHQLGLIAAPSTHMGTGCKRIAPGLFQSLYLRVGPGGGGTQESVEASVE